MQWGINQLPVYNAEWQQITFPINFVSSNKPLFIANVTENSVKGVVANISTGISSVAFEVFLTDNTVSSSATHINWITIGY